jgi:hypothetical protein
VSYRRRTKRELAYMAAYAILMLAFGIGLTVGVPALLLFRAVDDDGANFWRLVSGIVGVAWIAVLGYAVVSDRETRGWVAFALVGWLPYLWQLLRRLSGRREEPD